MWLLLQALLALTLTTGIRGVAGPLHWHGAAAEHTAHAVKPGQVARHHHDGDPTAVALDQGAPASEDLGSGSSANAAAAPWPAPTSQAALRPAREHRVAGPPAATWADAELPHPDHPPRG